MPEKVARCPLCENSESVLFERVIFRGSLVVNRRCTACGLVYQSPRMTEEEQQTFYEKEYRQIYEGTDAIQGRELAIQAGRAAFAEGFLEGRISPPRRHLDVGCGVGSLLLRVQSRYGCEAVGVEPDPIRREYARQQGLSVYASLQELKVQESSSFELISLYHVLEHLSDPVGSLRMFRKELLVPGGWLLVEVPNLYAHDSFEIAHLIAFSSHTLLETMRRAGYDVLVVKKHGRPRSFILPLYITLLARPTVSSGPPPTSKPKPERGVPLKRQLGMLRRRALQKLFPEKAWVPFDYSVEKKGATLP